MPNCGYRFNISRAVLSHWRYLLSKWSIHLAVRMVCADPTEIPTILAMYMYLPLYIVQ